MGYMETPSRLSDLTDRFKANTAARAYSTWLAIRIATFGNVDGVSALDFARKHIRGGTLQVIEKAATGAITAGSAGVDHFRPLAHDWADLVRRRTTLGNMGSSVRNIPPMTNVTTVDSGTAAAFVAEGSPIPVVKPAISDAFLQPYKLGLITPYTRELARRSIDRMATLIERDQARAVAIGEDTALLDSLPAVAGERPASILNGLSAVGGGSPSVVEDDVLALLAAVRDGDAVSPYFVTSFAGARYLLTQRESGQRVFPNVLYNGGTIHGVPLLVSAGSPDILTLVDGDAVHVVDEDLEIDISGEAAFQFDSEPVAGGQASVSLFQGNAVAVKTSRYISWRLAWSDGAAFINLPV